MYSDNIRRIREERGLTQVELAEKSGVSRSIINTLENGKRTTSTTTTLNKIANALDVQLSDILDGE